MTSARSLLFVLIALLALALAGCGGGGGSGSPGGQTVRVTGYVVSVESGGAIAPRPTVQIGSASVQADVNDGSFAIDAPKGSTEVLVTTEAYGTFRFTVPPLVEEGTDLGVLWVGPQKVTVTGTVVDATSNARIPGATVLFGGQRTTANAQGEFTIPNVAYAPNGAFGSIQGTARANGYFAGSFTAEGLTPSGGRVDVGTVLLTPVGDDTPPPGPYNIWGRVTPAADAPGATVVLSEGGNAIRQTTVGQDGRYFFWVPAGTYTLSFTKGNLSAGATVSLTDSNQVVQKDVTLSP
ncbi:MAG TPA: carboxypeptidase regulatory-like domain-containing protein [Fimbriimonas sp.]